MFDVVAILFVKQKKKEENKTKFYPMRSPKADYSNSINFHSSN